MLARRLLSALFVSLVFFAGPWSYAHAETSATFYDYLVGMQGKLIDYSKDFMDYAKTGQGDLQYEIPSDLNAVANSADTDISHVIDIYEIYDLVDRDDKIRIYRIIIDSLTRTSKKIDTNIDKINIDLSYAKRGVVIRSGSNLKQDLRDLKDRILEFRDSLKN